MAADQWRAGAIGRRRMTGRPTQAHVLRLLHAQGLPRASAERMAQEWLDHYDDVVDAYPDSAHPDEISHIMGSFDHLSVHVAHYQLSVQTPVVPGSIATLGRWTGACTGGVLTTLALFVALGQLLS